MRQSEESVHLFHRPDSLSLPRAQRYSPLIQNIVYQYAFRYYATGPLQYRFSKLMEKNITPILKIMSEKYNKIQKKVEIEKEVDL